MDAFELGCAALSSAIYIAGRNKANQTPIPPGATQISLPGLPDGHTADPTTGFEAGLYQYQDQYVIAYAGTDVKDPHDLVTDATLAAGITEAQMREAAEFYEKVKARVGEDNVGKIVFTGHSLGGGLAALMGVFFNKQAVTFDPAPFRLAATLDNAQNLQQFLTTATPTRSAYAVDPDLATYTTTEEPLTVAMPVLAAKLAAIAAGTSEVPVLGLGITASVAGLILTRSYPTIIRGESNIKAIAVSGEFLTNGIGFLSKDDENALRIKSTAQPELIDINPSDVQLSGTDLHSIALLNVVAINLQNTAGGTLLVDMFKKDPIFLREILDKSLFLGEDPNEPKPEFLGKLLKEEYSNGTSGVGSGYIQKFANDLQKLVGDAGVAQTQLQNALALVAMEYYYNKDAVSATSIFSIANGGLHFKYSDIGAATYKSLPRLVSAIDAFLPSVDRSYLYNLGSQNAWHIQQGTDAMVWEAASNDMENNAAIGGVGNDYLAGGAGRDILIGGAGDDVLVAGTGGDTLLGGLGFDTYVFKAGDGSDTVVDYDDQGQIIIDGVKLTGGKAVAADNKFWGSDDSNSVTFALIPTGSGTQDLLIEYGNHDSIRVVNYTPGALGITLQDFAAPTSPSSPPTNAPDNVINGDLAPTSFGTDQTPHYDGLGNLITDPNSPEPGRNDTLHGSSGNDLINAGGGDNKILAIQGGDDTINCGDGNNVITGGDGRNQVTVGSGTDYITLGNGANSVIGGTGRDGIALGDGNNLVEGNSGRDVIVAGNGNNEIYADKKIDLASAIANRDNVSASGQQGNLIAVGSGNNTIVSGTGNDAIFLGGGNDVVVLGPGNDTVVGGEVATQAVLDWNVWSTLGHLNFEGIAPVSSGAYAPSAELAMLQAQYPDMPQYHVDDSGNPAGGGSETILAGSGNSLIITSNGNNYIDAGSGNSTVYAGGGDDTIFAGTGNSAIYAGGGDDYIDGESGNHFIVGGAGNNTIIGGSGNDTIYAGIAGGASTADINAGNNCVDTGSGDSIVYGSAGNDTLRAGSGQVTIVAGNGNTVVYGGTGVDLIYGGSGTDLIYAGDGGIAAAPTTVVAGSGNTTIYGGLGIDVIYGGSGTNVIYAGDGGSAAQRSVVYAGSGDTTVYGGLGVDEIHGGSGNAMLYAGDGGTADAPTLVFAGTGNNTLYGGAGYDILYASAGGNTLLVGGSGTETLLGGPGDDTLVAGSGADILNGGAGSNTYLFNGGFGSSEIVQSGGTETLQFGPGISANDLSISATVGVNGAPALQISFGSGAVVVDGGFSGQVGSVMFADGTSLSLAQLATQAQLVPSVIASTPGETVLFDGSGTIHVKRYAADGTELSDTWKSLDGSAGGVTFNADGSSQATTVLANGSIQYQFNDGKGDTRSFTYSNGYKSADSWTNANGDAGSDTFNADGSSAGITTHADNASSAYTDDGQGNKVTKYYVPNGSLIADAWSKADGTSGSDTFDGSGNVTAATTVAVDGSRTVQANDGLGNTSTTQYDSAGNKTSDVWQSADGSHGSGQLANGVWTGFDYSVDGSYTESTLDASGNTSAKQFNSDGALIGTFWSHADGMHGNTALAADGSSDTYVYNLGGSYNETKTDAVGNSVTNYYDANGTLLYDTWHHADGTSGSDYPSGSRPDVAANFQQHGFYAIVTTDVDGNKTINLLRGDNTPIYSIYENQIVYDQHHQAVDGGYGGGFKNYWSRYGDFGGGAGSPFENPFPVAILQVTAGANGVREVQEVGWGGDTGYLKNTEILANGSLFENSWAKTASDLAISGQSVVSSTTTDGPLPGGDPFSQGGTGRLSGQSSSGWAVVLPGGIPAYIDDNGVHVVGGIAINYTGLPQSSTGGLDLAGLISSMATGAIGTPDSSNTVGGVTTVTKTYSGGGIETSHVVSNKTISDSGTDGQGGRWSTTWTPNDYSDIGFEASTVTTGTGYSYTMTTPWGGSSTNADGYTDATMYRDEVYRNPDGSVAETNHASSDMSGPQTGVLHDQNGNTISSTFNTRTQDSGWGTESNFSTVAVDQAGEVIRSNYQWWDDPLTSEVVTSSWTAHDGTQVSASLNSMTDSYQVTSRYIDGTYSVVTSDAQGGYFARNYDVTGALVSDQWQAANGDVGTDTFQADGSTDSSSTLHLSGNVVESVTTVTQADTSYLRNWTKTDGSSGTDIHNADGTGSGTAQFADETYNTYTATAQGVITALNFDASGAEVNYSIASSDSAGNWLQTTYDLNGIKLSDRWTHADGTSGSDVFNVDGSVETKTSRTNAQGVAITADKLVQPDSSFVQTWYGSDGSTGTDIGNADGSVSGTSDSPTAGHSSYMDDGHGNVSHTFTATADDQTLIGTDVGTNVLQADAAYNGITLQGGSGNDTFYLNAAAGNYDIAQLGDGSNVVYGQDGDNEVDAGNGSNAIFVGNGQNYVFLGDGNNTVRAGDGDNFIRMGAGNNQIWAGNGNNSIGVAGVAGSTNSIWVGDGNDTIGVAAGINDIQIGSGVDTVYTGDGVNTIHLASGLLTLNNRDAKNTVNFASTVRDDQLWFAQNGNDLLVTVDGTFSSLRLTNWFNGGTHATLVAGDGHQLIDSQVNSLVQAMAQFAPPAVGQTTLPQPQHDNLMPVIAASWR